MVKIQIDHTTTYRYNEPVTFGDHRVMVRPREGHDLQVLASILDVTPAQDRRWFRDVNGNSIVVLRFKERANELRIYSSVTVAQYDTDRVSVELEPHARTFPFRYSGLERADLVPYLLPVYPEHEPLVTEFVSSLWNPEGTTGTMDMLHGLNELIHESMTYQRREEMGVQTPRKTLELRSGSCRDYAVLFMEACRHWGIAARFVSGYVLGTGVDGGPASTHAWVEVYLPGAGWDGWDPTNRKPVGHEHVAVAVSRHPAGASVVSGSFTGATNASAGLEVGVQVKKL